MTASYSCVSGLTALSEDIRGKVVSTLRAIVSLCEQWRGDGAAFQLKNHPTTYNAVVGLLRDMDDSLLSLTEARAWEIVSVLEGLTEEDRNGAAWLLALRGTGQDITTIARFDRDASRLFYLIEAWIAIGFAERLSGGSIVAELLAYMGDPSGSGLWRDAVRSGTYSATMITSGRDANTRRGIPTAPLLALVLDGQNALADGFQAAVQSSFAAQGASYYGVRRASNYPCEACDEVCSHIYPVGVVVLPVHPHCVCEPYIIE